MTTPLLIGIFGTPGVGKTYISQQLAMEARRAGDLDRQLVHLNSDFFRHTLFKNAKHNKKENQVIFQAMEVATHALLSQGYSVIFDTNAILVKHRENLARIAKEHEASYRSLHVVDSMEKCLERNELRKEKQSKYFNHAPEEVLHAFTTLQELPESWERSITLDLEQKAEVDYQELLSRLFSG